MNIGTLARASAATPATTEAAPPGVMPAAGEGGDAFFDLLSLLSGLTAGDEKPLDETPAPLEAEVEDASVAMPAMNLLPGQNVPVLPVHAAPVSTVAPEAAAPTPEADPAAAVDGAARPVAGKSLPMQPLPTVDAAARANLRVPEAVVATVRREAQQLASPAPLASAATLAPGAPGAPAPVSVDEGGAQPLVAVAPHLSTARDDTPALKLAPGTPTQWRQPLTEALGDRLQLNLQRGSEQAVIRLDPPQLGRVEIAIRHEAGALQVHLSATHGEVLRQLHAIGDHLRHDLGQRTHGDVSVVVSDAAGMGRDADGRSRGRQPEPDDHSPGRALAEAEDGASAAFRLGDSMSEA